MHTSIRRTGQRNCIYAALRQELMNEMFQHIVGDDDSVNYEVDLDRQHFAMVGDKGKVTATAHLLASIAAKPPTLLWGYSDILARFGLPIRYATTAWSIRMMSLPATRLNTPSHPILTKAW